MVAWHLNPALTSWRAGVNARLPSRRKDSDGTIGDLAHQSRDSEHNRDPDGSVDAFDIDVNLLGSGTQTGSAAERRLIEALKKDFEADRRSALWIHDREIASRAIDSWRERRYDGDNPHDRHVHWQSRPEFERDGSTWKFTHTDALLREMNIGGGAMLPSKNPSAKPSEDVKFWQYMLNEMGYGAIMGPVDGVYGEKMAAAVNADRKARGAMPMDEITGWHGLVMMRSLAQKYAGQDGLPGAPGRNGVDGVLTGTLRIDGGVLEATAIQGDGS